MIHFLNLNNAPFMVEYLISAIAVVVGVLVLYGALTIIISCLSSINDWVHDNKRTYKYSMTDIVTKLFNLTGYSIDRWHTGMGYFIVMGLAILFYYVAAVAFIVYLIMYTLRATIRIKTALSKHISDKKAHQ